MAPRSASAMDPSLIDYQSDVETLNSDYQSCWSGIMDQRNGQRSSNYAKVVALLLCWKEDCHDMPNTQQEVEKLKSVLEKKFHYSAKIEYLDSKLENITLQSELNFMVAKFVREHGGPNNLLIVYYGGHGKPGKTYGQLELVGSVD